MINGNMANVKSGSGTISALVLKKGVSDCTDYITSALVRVVPC